VSGSRRHDGGAGGVLADQEEGGDRQGGENEQGEEGAIHEGNLPRRMSGALRWIKGCGTGDLARARHSGAAEAGTISSISKDKADA
jgi:hypothetical protein